MNILVLTQFFPPESCAASSRTKAVSEHLSQIGHAVQVITAYPSFPTGAVPERYRAWMPMREHYAGARVLRVPTYASPRLRGLDRILNWSTVSIGATLAAIASRQRFDCVYVTCPPVTLALPTIAAAKRHGCPLFVDVRDSYPDVAVKMGVWEEDAFVSRAVASIVRRLYESAAAVFCVTPGVREEVLARGAHADKTFIAPNGFDQVQPAPEPAFARSPGDFVAAFAGNIGVAAGVDVILEAAALLRDAPHIRFAIAGGGAGFAALKARREAYGLQNVQLFGAMERRQAMAVLRDANICVVPLKQGIHDSLPTKIFDALYMGCPILVAGDGEAGDFAARSGGGWSVPAENAGALAAAIRRAAADPEECRRSGAAGRSYVLANWDRGRGVSTIAECIAAARN